MTVTSASLCSLTRDARDEGRRRGGARATSCARRRVRGALPQPARRAERQVRDRRDAALLKSLSLLLALGARRGRTPRIAGRAAASYALRREGRSKASCAFCSRSRLRRSCCYRRRRRRTRRTRPPSRSPARSSRRPAAPGDWDPALRGHASHLRRGRRRLAGHVHAPRRQLRVQGRAQQRVGRELRPARGRRTARTSRSTAPGGPRQVLLRPQDALGDRQQELGDRRRAGQLPVRARLPGRLGSGLPALVAPGSRRRRDLHVRDDRAARRRLRDQGRDQRELGRELRRRAACPAARTSRSASPRRTRR